MTSLFPFLYHKASLSAFLVGCLMTQYAIWTFQSLLDTALLGFIGAFASYIGTWIAGRVLPKKKRKE